MNKDFFINIKKKILKLKGINVILMILILNKNIIIKKDISCLKNKEN